MGILIHWGHTLCEPLLPPRSRSRLEGNLAKVHREAPDRVHLFLGGLISEAIPTLPDDDWRHLSARCGSVTCGECPPDDDGTVKDSDGEEFGTWRDAVDVSGFEAVTPWDDPALIAPTEGLVRCRTVVRRGIRWFLGTEVPEQATGGTGNHWG